jgi:peptide/nickel transport system substrate-binding protein
MTLNPARGVVGHRLPAGCRARADPLATPIFDLKEEVQVITNKKVAMLIALVTIASMLLTACGATPEPQVVVQTVKETVIVEGTPQVVEKEVTQVVKETVPVEVVQTVEVQITPTPAPVERKGGWLDTIIYLEEPSSQAAITRLDVDEMDIYAYAISDPELYRTVQADDKLASTFSYGSYNELTFNTCKYDPSLGLNPFSSQKFREAMNWLVDRDYIVQEIFGGLAVARYTSFNTTFPDFAKTATTQAAIAAKYAPDAEKAKEVMAQEMEAMGATMVDGKWTFNGAPVTLIFLIRVEDERRAIGDYVSNLLEDAGFTVDRQYKTSAEASALWVRSDPCEGLWTIYTAGWVSTQISRDLATNFEFFYTPRGYPIPLWQIYTPSPELDTCADRLNRNDFATLDERTELMNECLMLSMEDSVRIFINDRKSFTPRDKDTAVGADLAGAVYASRLNGYVMRFVDKVGGQMTVGMPSILTDPWNPVAGTNWVYDMRPLRDTGDFGMQVDPYTGLRYPQRIERAEVTYKEGLPGGRGGDSEDWLSIDYAPEIVVPDDAWVDWDATNQVFITAAEKFTQTVTANQKTVVYYPEDLYQTAWHDGSPVSVADFVMDMIMTFEPGKPDSPIFDSSAEETVKAYLDAFRGVRITSIDPLVIETYSDNYYLEAELLDLNYDQTWYPNTTTAYPYGSGAWHTVGLMTLPEAAGELAFSSAKADEKGIEWMSTIGGPSLEILAGHLVSATAESFIPYEPTLGQFLDADEVATRWQNLSEWYRKYGHFQVGTGPYYMQGAFPLEGTVILRQNPNYIDNADRWSGFSEPKIAEAEVDGPGRVDVGSEATFDVFVTFGGEPYPAAELDSVTYLLFDTAGAIVSQGDAAFVTDGQYQVTLSSDETSKLQAGASKLQAVVVSKLVAIPTFATYEFVTQ